MRSNPPSPGTADQTIGRAGTASGASPSRWWALVLLAMAEFVVILDASIVNIALPSIGRGLHISLANLSWVVNAYVLTFGGFLLLGGRIADLVGRRRVFAIGLAVFSSASLAGGLAQSSAWLIAARAIQGLGAALLAPAALSLVISIFREGAERNQALSVWGAVAGSGAAAGVLLGGVLTSALGWRWVLFVNVPIGIAAIALTPGLLAESRGDLPDRNFDLPGAITVTGGLSAMVYALVRASTVGWGSPQTIGVLAAAAVLLAAFLVIEGRAQAPLVPFAFFRNTNVTAANATMLGAGAAILGLFYFLSLYMQKVLGYSAITAGVSQLPLALGIVLAAVLASPLVSRYGTRPVLVASLALFAGGLVWFAQLPVHGSYRADILGPSCDRPRPRVDIRADHHPVPDRRPRPRVRPGLRPGQHLSANRGRLRAGRAHHHRHQQDQQPERHPSPHQSRPHPRVPLRVPRRGRLRRSRRHRRSDDRQIRRTPSPGQRDDLKHRGRAASQKGETPLRGSRRT